MKVNQLKAGVMLSYLTMFLSTGISIVYTPMMLSLLGQSEYGLYQLVASVVSYLSLLTLGFGGAYVRFYSRYKVNNDENSIAKLNGMFLTAFSIIGVVALLCGGVLTANIENIFSKSLTSSEIDIARILMVILVINIGISMPASVFNSYITANERYFFQKILGLIKTLTNPFLMIIVLLMGFGSIGMVVVTTTLNIIFEIAYVIYAFKKLNMEINFKGFDFSLLKEIAVFSSFIFINIIVDQVNWSVDKFLLGMYQGTAVVAIYAVGAQINTYYLSFSTAISGVFVPKVNKIVAKANDNKELTNLFTRVGRIQFAVLMLILSGFFIFGEVFVKMWAGSEYLDAYKIALILIIPVTLPLIQNIGIEIQ
ncbi:MAG: oligosaccharide flippase family protein, partial [Clostridia bacterium]